jgi:hypothetical protein
MMMKQRQMSWDGSDARWFLAPIAEPLAPSDGREHMMLGILNTQGRVFQSGRHRLLARSLPPAGNS